VVQAPAARLSRPALRIEKKDSFGSGDAELRSKETPAMPSVEGHAPNPKRVAAGRVNRQKRKGLTPAGQQRLRESAVHHRPWRFATGPRTAAGKARSAANGKSRQQGPCSVRQIRRDLADLRALLQEMRDARQLAGSMLPV
jgi:hypothetical protein